MRYARQLSLALILLTAHVPVVAQQQPNDSPHLGVFTKPIRPGDLESGLRIAYIFPQSAAEAMGLQVGDEIVTLDDAQVPNRRELTKQLRSQNKVGTKVRFVIRRNGEKIKVKGKLGSWRKTMGNFQSVTRKRLYGKPLPPLPPISWWDPKAQNWAEKADGLAHLKGKLGIIFSFDDCARCVPKRYEFFQGLKTRGRSLPLDPLDYVGLYQSSAQDEKGVTSEHAAALFKGKPPEFPVAVVLAPEKPISPEERTKLLYVLQHGIVVLDREGIVRYVQIMDEPGHDFRKALAEIIKDLQKTSSSGNKP